jgi:hypothetical protein
MDIVTSDPAEAISCAQIRPSSTAPLLVQIVFPVPIIDLAARRNPDLLARFYVRKSMIEIFAAMGMPDQERVQAD